jgi:hypothetical protein
VSATSKFAYGQTVYVQLVELMPHDERLAYVPQPESESFLEAYSGSLYETLALAEAAIKDGGDDQEFVREGVVNEDGSITFTEGDTLSAELIWGRYELSVPDFSTKTPTL